MSSNPLNAPETSMTLSTIMIQPNPSEILQLKEHISLILQKIEPHWERREIGAFVCGVTFGFGLHHFHWVGSVVADVNTRQSQYQNDIISNFHSSMIYDDLLLLIGHNFDILFSSSIFYFFCFARRRFVIDLIQFANILNLIT